MCGAHGDARERGYQQADRARRVRRKALVGLEFDHIHSDRLDNAVATDGSPNPHDNRAENHQPQRDGKIRHSRLPVCQRRAEQEHRHEFLSVLRAVHECHCRATRNLRLGKKTVAPRSVTPPEQKGDQFRHPEPQTEAQHGGEKQSPQDFLPLSPIHARKVAVYRNRRARQTRNQRVALAGGDSEVPRRRCPYDDCRHRRAKRDQRLVRVPAEIHHAVNGHRHRRVDGGHHQNAEKVADRRHDNGFPQPDRPR